MILTDERPSVALAILRGLGRRCPNCGVGRSFTGYLKVTGHCDHCRTELGHIRADDFPPYLTIAIVGHLSVPLFLMSEQYLSPPTWLQLGIGVPLVLGLTLALLPRVKGGILGLMWHLGLRGDETQ